MSAQRARPATRRRRKDADKPPPPKILEPFVAKAKSRHARRHANPGVAVDIEYAAADSYVIASPHSDTIGWEVMVWDALGTRSVSTAETFLYHLADLCSQSWHPDPENGGRWIPDEDQLNMILNMVASIKPRNEMQAALAAQMVAVHLMTMKAAGEALKGWGVDPRTAAVAGKLARTFVMQSEALAKLKGRKTTRQTITVHYEKSEHKHVHQHVHADREGGESGEQPHATPGTTEPSGSTSLPSPDQGGRVVSVGRGEGNEGLPDARRSRVRRT